ncbi:3-deoxy-D-manno-octulosonic acid transferase [Shimia biformata]|uniref:3-deoxy-D-manno-octulosonic acid transferase n=1 Tax=Shimia biformata TaxID=1294299 RepID=UPI001950964C|nr:glycosyltransferase N-terminal domain-containing protein [Shimia biformata]
MARAPLSLSAYLAFARREPAGDPIERKPRPDGRILWLHCADPARARALVQLAQRLVSQRSDFTLLLTLPGGMRAPDDVRDSILTDTAPGESPTEVAAFLNHWSPTVGLWLGQWLRPALTFEAHRRGVAMYLLDAGEPRLENKRFRLLPEPTRATLRLFDAIFAHSSVAGTRIRRQLPEDAAVIDSGPVLEEGMVRRCNEGDLEELRSTLAGRPVWLAAMIQKGELDAIVSAHRATQRLSHRLMMVLVPGSPDLAVPFRERLRAADWRVACWDDGEFPDENTQILLSEDLKELGLWYRVAPVTFMGSSLTPGFGGKNPMEPAALGSAVLYGPGVRNHLESYTRLARAGAARIVRDSASLTAALGLLTAPDQIATMAQAGWETVTESAETSDQIIAHVLDRLDEEGI